MWLDGWDQEEGNGGTMQRELWIGNVFQKPGTTMTSRPTAQEVVRQLDVKISRGTKTETTEQVLIKKKEEMKKTHIQETQIYPSIDYNCSKTWYSLVKYCKNK